VKVICKDTKEYKDITLDKEYPVRNSYGVKNDFKLEIMNDDGVYEEYERSCFEVLK